MLEQESVAQYKNISPFSGWKQYADHNNKQWRTEHNYGFRYKFYEEKGDVFVYVGEYICKAKGIEKRHNEFLDQWLSEEWNDDNN